MVKVIISIKKKERPKGKNFRVCNKVKDLLLPPNILKLKYYGFNSISHVPKGKLQPETHVPPFVNKVLLEHSHIHSFTFVCGCFPATTAVLSSFDRNYKAKKPKYLLKALKKFSD